MKIKTRQDIVFSDALINGVFRYKDLFQIRPMHPEAPSIDWEYGHHPCLLEYVYQVPDVTKNDSGPDLSQKMIFQMVEEEAATKEKKWILLVLSTFAKSRIFQYSEGIHQHQWFNQLPRNPSDIDISKNTVWGQSGFKYKNASAWIIDNFSTTTYPQISFIETNEYFRTETLKQFVIGQTSAYFELPDKIDIFLNAFLSLTEEHKRYFLSSCFLLDQGITLFFHAQSLAFAACVSSLETLVTLEHKGEKREQCKCCEQINYHIRQNFLGFIKKYGSDSPEARKAANKVYERRSKILHAGELFDGETEPKTIEGSIDWLNDEKMRRDVIRFFRTCIINWLLINTKEIRTL